MFIEKGVGMARGLVMKWKGRRLLRIVSAS